MATPCSNCVYKGTKYCAIFCGRWWAVAFFLLVLVSSAWCRCYQNPSGFRSVTTTCSGLSVSSKTACQNANPTIVYTPQQKPNALCGYGSAKVIGQWTSSPVCDAIGGGYYGPWARLEGYCYSSECTQAEIDSLTCVHYPDRPECATEIDTTLFACSDNATGNGALYRLACKAINGEVKSCNGKTNVDIATDGSLVRPLQGTCAQNGFNTGIIGGASSDSTSTPPSANADCFAVVGSTCHMKDKASGNTFRCECDGSCNVALRNLMAGNADCMNPYEQPEQSDSLDLPLSSPSSSGSGEGSSPSSSPSGEGNSSDFEYDYTEVLEAIQANTQQTATELGRSNEFLNNIQNNTETANSLLQAIANKDWSPNINVSAPNVNVQGDTNIINVEVSGDTARAPREILEFMRDTSGIGGYAGQFENEKAQALAWADSVHASAVSFADSISGVEVPDMSDSLGSAVQGVSGALRTLKDTLDNSAISDSMDRWADLITDNGVITGDGSNDCPDILTQTYSWGFTIAGTTINVPVGSLGEFVCNPISPFGITIWAFCRVILRAIVAIGCMFWIYRAVLGIDNSGGDD